ncbi:RecQ-mediated genome instability protein 1-like protein [Drosera capensis]
MFWAKKHRRHSGHCRRNPRDHIQPPILRRRRDAPLRLHDAEDFVDVSDNLCPQSRSPTTDASLDLPPVVAPNGTDCPVGGCLRGLGLSLRRDWLTSCLRGFEGAVPGFSEFDVATKARMCLGDFLFADMNLIGAGVLPDNVDSLHLVDLPGPFVLQIGMEYRPIKDLAVLAPAGFKIVLRDVNIRLGLLLLVPENLDILGGYVEELEAARQRLVHEVNKPPRGKRSRTGVMPSLTSRANAAAWQPHGASNLMATNHSTRPQDEVNAFANNSTIQSSGPVTIEESCTPTLGESAVSHFDSSAVDVVEDGLMVDEAELPFFLLGDKELPFTYLASLSAKWASLKEHKPCVKGKIKCFLTGVKGFQYKQRTTSELRVYVDDGSLISEILIHHDVVQKGIGYSPKEVTAALTSSNTVRVGNMKETLKQFQIFLVNFEGTMLIEMNKASPVPVAFEMNQGCPVSDAWLLVQRLKSSAYPSGQPCRNIESDPIDLSP